MFFHICYYFSAHVGNEYRCIIPNSFLEYPNTFPTTKSIQGRSTSRRCNVRYCKNFSQIQKSGKPIFIFKEAISNIQRKIWPQWPSICSLTQQIQVWTITNYFYTSNIIFLLRYIYYICVLHIQANNALHSRSSIGGFGKSSYSTRVSSYPSTNYPSHSPFQVR